ncbi:MAG TPA: nickel transporter permease [Methanospirillum sp.]|uniref:nickel transporter permease n=1 Tax=Methanospirillum sp. TaxID=45200 RepID=UPI002B5F28F7|nr:nickel transporter permease [Methanospirillum sp.]HWQ63019.1 nickel transporter permease [Methanospirillum sp.]
MSRMYDKLKMDRSVQVGFCILLIVIILGVCAPLITSADPYLVNLSERLQSPSYQHIMGTDELGRDYFSRLLYGTRVSLLTAIAVTFGCLIIGVSIGLIAGYAGNVVDEILMRIVDIFLSFPSLLLAFAVAGLLGPSTFNLILAMVATGWVSYSRVIRSEVLVVKEQDFILSAKAIGCNHFRIITRHIIPNIIGPIIVLATLDIGIVLLGICGMSYLGLGSQPPIPEWGSMLNAGQKYMGTVPTLMFFPGFMIFITVFSCNLVGDGLRDVLDPKNVDGVQV